MTDRCGHGITWKQECKACNAVSAGGYLYTTARMCNKACAEIENCDLAHLKKDAIEEAAKALQRLHNVLCNINALHGA